MRRLALAARLIAPALVASLAHAEVKPGSHVLKPLSDDFQRLATLVGEWEGDMTETDGSVKTMRVEYYLTSGNSALVERLMKDTPMEMTSVYHDHGEQLQMTHYCGLGNQPRYRSAGFEKDRIVFDFHDATNMASPTERHMHGVTLELTPEGDLIHTWRHFDKGKETGEVSLRLKRVE